MLTVVWAWWAWKQGAYFGTVELPGTVVLCAGTVLLAWVAPLRGRLAASPPVRVALGGLVALGLWSLLSAIWSPAPDVAITDAQRVLTYGLAFGFGICLCNLLGARMSLAIVPIAVAGGAIALATTVTLLTGHDVKSYLEIDGTLQYPLGYRNANGAYFGIAFWTLVGTAGIASLAWWVRSLSAGAAALCLALVLLSQSRGSQLAGAVSLVVFLAIAPRRARALIWLLIAAVPCIVVVPHLSDLFETTSVRPSVATVHSAAAACLIAGAIAALAGAALALAERSVTVSERASRNADRAVSRGLVAVAAVGVVAFLIAVGNPVSWVDQKASQFNQGFGASATSQATRFGTNVGTHRGEIWSVALGDAGRDPVLGDGAGGFQYSYLLHRTDGQQTVHDAHSVELETLSELGVPGLLMWLAFLVGAGVGIQRARRLGPSAAVLAAIAVTAGSYWLVHTSIDWFWPYPAVTAPVIALLGAACAPTLRTATLVKPGRWRVGLGVGAVVLALSAIPPFFSKSYVNQAFGEWRTDFPRAMSDLDQAHSLWPMSVDPLMAKGAIARAAGNRAVAIGAFSQVTRQRPREWAAHYYLALLYRKSSPQRARQELAAALADDPREPILLALRKQL